MLLPPWQKVEKEPTLEAESDPKETAHFGHVDAVVGMPRNSECATPNSSSTLTVKRLGLLRVNGLGEAVFGIRLYFWILEQSDRQVSG